MFWLQNVEQFLRSTLWANWNGIKLRGKLRTAGSSLSGIQLTTKGCFYSKGITAASSSHTNAICWQRKETQQTRPRAQCSHNYTAECRERDTAPPPPPLQTHKRPLPRTRVIHKMCLIIRSTRYHSSRYFELASTLSWFNKKLNY